MKTGVYSASGWMLEEHRREPRPSEAPTTHMLFLSNLRWATSFRGGHIKAATLQECLRTHKLGSLQGEKGEMFADSS